MLYGYFSETWSDQGIVLDGDSGNNPNDSTQGQKRQTEPST